MKPSPAATRSLVCVLLALAILQPALAQDWKLLWNDEFENDTVDPNYWTKEVGFLGFNAEFQTYSDSPENIRVQDGKLHINAIRDLTAQVGYTSGRLNTLDKVQVKYGMVEASIKIPDMKMGLWPAFWTLGENYPEVGWPKAGELDILEAGQKQGSAEGLGNHRVVTAIHWDALGNYVVEDGHIDMPYDLSADFHTYKMVWQPDFIEMFVDDNLVRQYRIDYCENLWDCGEFHQYHFMVLNLAVAGLFTCCEYGFELNDYDDGTSWTMEVDYVRVYGNENTEVILPEGYVTSPLPAPGATAAPATAMPTIQATIGNATSAPVAVTGIPFVPPSQPGTTFAPSPAVQPFDGTITEQPTSSQSVGATALATEGPAALTPTPSETPLANTKAPTQGNTSTPALGDKTEQVATPLPEPTASPVDVSPTSTPAIAPTVASVSNLPATTAQPTAGLVQVAPEGTEIPVVTALPTAVSTPQPSASASSSSEAVVPGSTATPTIKTAETVPPTARPSLRPPTTTTVPAGSTGTAAPSTAAPSNLKVITSTVGQTEDGLEELLVDATGVPTDAPNDDAESTPSPTAEAPTTDPPTSRPTSRLAGLFGDSNDVAVNRQNTPSPTTASPTSGEEQLVEETDVTTESQPQVENGVVSSGLKRGVHAWVLLFVTGLLIV